MWVVWAVIGGLAAARGQAPRAVRIASKSFTESVILGEMLCALARHAEVPAVHESELGGTQIVWRALVKGDIDAYVEYSGTLAEEILTGEHARELSDIQERVARDGILTSPPLGFNNTYALGMREDRAAALGITRISDLRSHPQLSCGFSDEFVERGDGWHGLCDRYQLPQRSVRAMDHSLAYRGVWKGSIDVMDLYSTDPEIIFYQLRVLEDDRAYFPLYEAVIVYRAELEQSHPQLVAQFLKLAGTIDNARMAAMNKAVRIDRQPEAVVAAQFLHDHVDPAIVIPDARRDQRRRRWLRFATNTWEHLLLVSISLSAAIAVAIPLGIAAYKWPRAGHWILGVVGTIQTIPSMALLVFMIPLLGLGAPPAILALFLYSLLPIVRGTHTGLTGLPDSIHESALALGLPDGARLRLIELPLAAPAILAGIKTSAVINVGTATIGALIGAGGYGQPIITGIRLANLRLILAGAIPAAILALLVQAAFGWAERYLIPAGLRAAPSRE